MRINKTKSKNKEHYSIIQDVNVNGKRTTKVYENIGNFDTLKLRAGDEEPLEWLQKYVEELNKKHKENSLPVIMRKNPNKLIEKDVQNSFNVGYLFLQDIYYKLRLNEICNTIAEQHQFKFDLNDILSKLIYSRIIFPASKLKTLELSRKFLEQPNFDYQHIERALPIICENMDFIQSELYKNSNEYMERNNKILYYDCTNYYFEIEEESGLKQYGKSKENRPNPIVQMGLFMDGNGIPLAFDITSGNTNEQVTLQPLEEKIMKDFELSKFVVCTDGGLSSIDNRKFNNKDNKAFITTQSIKKLKKHLKEWALSKNGWRLEGEKKEYNISHLEDTEESKKLYYNKIFYKKRWIKENDLEQVLIVTYSIKYKNYQKRIRDKQLERARNLLNNKSLKLDKVNQNDYKRFIKKINVTKEGEIAENKVYTINENQIAKEEMFDGFYGVRTNLEDDVPKIIKVNQRRWEIEESFRIMKSEFRARPVYLSRDDRIQAHFMTCYISLLIHRILEKKLNEEYTSNDIIETLRNMNLYKEISEGYIPTYTRTDLTDKLHEISGFRTDYEITTEKNMKKILKNIKK